MEADVISPQFGKALSNLVGPGSAPAEPALPKQAAQPPVPLSIEVPQGLYGNASAADLSTNPYAQEEDFGPFELGDERHADFFAAMSKSAERSKRFEDMKASVASGSMPAPSASAQPQAPDHWDAIANARAQFESVLAGQPSAPSASPVGMPSEATLAAAGLASILDPRAGLHYMSVPFQYEQQQRQLKDAAAMERYKTEEIPAWQQRLSMVARNLGFTEDVVMEDIKGQARQELESLRGEFALQKNRDAVAGRLQQTLLGVQGREATSLMRAYFDPKLSAEDRNRARVRIYELTGADIGEITDQSPQFLQLKAMADLKATEAQYKEREIIAELMESAMKMQKIMAETEYIKGPRTALANAMVLASQSLASFREASIANMYDDNYRWEQRNAAEVTWNAAKFADDYYGRLTMEAQELRSEIARQDRDAGTSSAKRAQAEPRIKMLRDRLRALEDNLIPEALQSLESARKAFSYVSEGIVGGAGLLGENSSTPFAPPPQPSPGQSPQSGWELPGSALGLPGLGWELPGQGLSDLMRGGK